MALSRDDIDAVSITLDVDGELVFSVLLTRGGLTRRMGSSEGTDPGAVLVTGGTDSYFEDFLGSVPDAVLERGGRLEDEGREGPRHDWTFEFASGPNTLAYYIGYHWGSASLPDEFADMVVRAESLTHAWYLAGVAEATGAPAPSAPEASRPAARAERAQGARALSRPPGRGRPAPPAPATRERIALAVLLDFLALSVPYSLVHGLFIGAAERTGPPGGALVLFAIVEFALLQIARQSPGYWLLGISSAPGGKPRVDPGRAVRESPALLATGTGLCAVGVGALTAWTSYHTPVPYFGLPIPLWLSIPVTMLGAAALVLAGALLLRLDLRGVWLGAGVTLLMLLGSLVGWSDWPAFVAAARGGDVGGEPAGLLARLSPVLALAVSVLLGAGLFASWKRLSRRLAAPLPASSPRTHES